ncbi:MAG: hypothetical protein IJM90_01415 [Firmicutes bacterium]|nr:hypothetical protein [Bacillota bacterium]
MNKNSCICLILALLFLSGCSSPPSLTNSTSSFSKIYQYSPSAFSPYADCAMDGNGLFFFVEDTNNFRNLTLTYHADSSQEYVLCWNPECTHDREDFPDCPALFDTSSTFILSCTDESVYVLQANSEMAPVAGLTQLYYGYDLYEINLNAKTRNKIWEFKYDLDPLRNTGLEFFCLRNQKLYVFRSEMDMPNYEYGEYGSPDSMPLPDTYVEVFDFHSKKQQILYSIPNKLWDHWPIALTDQYLLLEEYDKETTKREYCRYSLQDWSREVIVSGGLRNGCVLLSESSGIFSQTEAGKTQFYLTDIDSHQEDLLGELPGEYMIQVYTSYQLGLSRAGFIAIIPCDNYMAAPLIYDWKTGKLYPLKAGYHLNEKAYDDQYFCFQYGTYLDWQLHIVNVTDAHDAIAALLERDASQE